MKKMGYISLGIVLASVLMSGCAGTDGGTTNPSQTVAVPQDTIAGSITLDDVLNHEATDESAFKYVERDGGIIIQGCTSEDEIIVIPETINGIKVTSIDDSAFANIKSTARGLYISDNVEIIDKYTLGNFEKLEIIVIGESISDIPQYFISNNPCLQYIEFTCPQIHSAEFDAVLLCHALKGIYFKGDVESIEKGAFPTNTIIYGKKDSNLQKAVEEIPGLTFEVID